MVEMNFSAGDRVRFRLALDEIDGDVLESAKDSDVVLIKLESGYNIGIAKENILGYRVLKKFKGKKEEKTEEVISDKTKLGEGVEGDNKGVEGHNKDEGRDERKAGELIKGKTERLDRGDGKGEGENEEIINDKTGQNREGEAGANRDDGDKSWKKYGKRKGLKSIGLVITGGTIAAKLDVKTGGVSWLSDVDEFMRFYPELGEIANVKKIEVPFMTASESMTSEHWIKIAESVKEMLDDNEISGVIVTHGTDFLHYTSSALSFFLGNLNKPVVLTYSQRSIDRASSDARLNLVCAAHMALSDCAEVMIVGHGSIEDNYCFALRGTKVRKMHTSRRDAFKSINCSPIAKIFGDGKIEYMEKYNKRDNQKKVKLDTKFNDKVALVKFYPGQDASILDFYALKYKGIVVEGSGLGHLPVGEASHSWISKLKKCIKDGMVVCMTSQCINGRVDGFVYSNGRELIDAGVIFLEDMLSECAFVKLGFVLGHYGWKERAGEKMLENMAGEISGKLGRE